ncbi:MAG: PorV/PorQ family protein [Chloroflexota bacterium]
MNKILSIIGLFALLTSVTAHAAEDPGRQRGSSSQGKADKTAAVGGQFLKIGVGARASAMGGAYSAVANDLTSLYWNPAGLANLHTITAEFDYCQYFADMSHSFAGASVPIGADFAAGISFTSFGTNAIPVTTIDHPEGTGATYDINDMAVGITFAGFLTEQFSFGITAKYINNSIASVSSSGVAFDIGTLYETGIQGIKLGFAIQNLGGEQEYQGQDLGSQKKLYEELWQAPLDVSYISSAYSLPLIFRAGVASDIYTQDEHKVTGAFDFITVSDVAEQYNLGAEYTWNDLLSLRAGYQFGNEQLGFSGGVGIKYLGSGFGGRFDYSISPTANLGLVNRFSIGVTL